MSLLLNPKAAPVAGGGNRVALLGTSLMQHHHTANSAFKLSTWSKGPLNWARTLNPGLFDMPAWYDPTVRAGWEPDGVGTVYFRGLNAGIGGAVLSEMWARRFYLANNVECDVVIIDGGTNDIPTQTKEYIHGMRVALVDFFLGLGKKVVLLPILARSTSSWSVASGYRKKAHWVNQQGFDYVAGRKGCYSLDWNKPWVDFNSADGSPKAGYSPDGTHFSTISAYEVGKELGNALKGFLVPRQRAIVAPDDLYDATLNPRGNLMPNPMLAGTAGTIGAGATGSVADNMRVVRQSGAGAVACSKVARSNGRGNAQQLVITPSGAAGTDLYYFQTAVTSVAHNLPVGTWVRASVEVDCGAWAGLARHHADAARRRYGRNHRLRHGGLQRGRLACRSLERRDRNPALPDHRRCEHAAMAHADQDQQRAGRHRHAQPRRCRAASDCRSARPGGLQGIAAIHPAMPWPYRWLTPVGLGVSPPRFHTRHQASARPCAAATCGAIRALMTPADSL